VAGQVEGEIMKLMRLKAQAIEVSLHRLYADGKVSGELVQCQWQGRLFRQIARRNALALLLRDLVRAVPG
jgi:hypothetical protein